MMPASFGFHPALRWPLPYGQPRAAHVITFEKEEKAPIRRLDSDGLVLPGGFPTPVAGRAWALRDDQFTDDAVIFDALASRRLQYGAKAGPQIEVGFADTPYLGVWTRPGADFICIEPWHGIADPQGFGGAFGDKPGLFQVAPGQAQRCGMTIGLHW
jgi:galactose mutarotase-like enzyme